MQKLSHPNIVKTLELHIDQEQGYVYYVMEYCKGTTLQALVEVENRIHPSEVRKYFSQLVAGVFYLHSNNIVHRDLSPNNIIVMKKASINEPKDGARPEVKIIDFNIAKFFSFEDMVVGGGKFLFRMHTETGTVNYRAPEIINQGSPYTEAVDIWSLGCLLYRMVEGKDPFYEE